jgi:hypothetical protein
MKHRIRNRNSLPNLPLRRVLIHTLTKLDFSAAIGGRLQVLVRLARRGVEHGFLAEGVPLHAKKGMVYNVIMVGSWFITGDFDAFARLAPR